MRKLLAGVPFACMTLGALLFVPNFAGAQSALTGTWKADLSHVDFPKKPDVYLLDKGMWECKTCTPAVSVKADGMDHAVSGHPYYDSVAVTVVGDHEIKETDKKGGKVVTTSDTKVSADGKTMMFSFVDSSDTNGGAPITGKGEETLVMKGPAGSHAVSGSWRMAKIENVSDNGNSVTYKVTGDSVTMTSPAGQSYTAKLDGTEAPMKGDPGVTSVRVKMVGKDVFEEMDYRDGKEIAEIKTTLGPDGKTAKVSFEDKLAMRTTNYSVMKQ